jgi:hypothetical protein
MYSSSACFLFEKQKTHQPNDRLVGFRKLPNLSALPYETPPKPADRQQQIQQHAMADVSASCVAAGLEYVKLM